MRMDWRGNDEREDREISWKVILTVQQRDDEKLEGRLRQENEEKGVVSRDIEEVDSVGLANQ